MPQTATMTLKWNIDSRKLGATFGATRICSWTNMLVCATDVTCGLLQLKSACFGKWKQCLWRMLSLNSLTTAKFSRLRRWCARRRIGEMVKLGLIFTSGGYELHERTFTGTPLASWVTRSWQSIGVGVVTLPDLVRRVRLWCWQTGAVYNGNERG